VAVPNLHFPLGNRLAKAPGSASIGYARNRSAFLLAFASLVVAIVLLVLLQLTRLGYLVRATIPDRPRRRMFIASVSFLITLSGCGFWSTGS
jgi:branched-subunit amino acid ABC-type transport system permease component